MATGTLLYAQSGGVTAVINATASAVIAAARARRVKVLAARNGILGALREELIDTSAERRGGDPRRWRTRPAAPSAAAASSSSRWKTTARATSGCSRCFAPTTCAGSSTTAATIRPTPR